MGTSRPSTRKPQLYYKEAAGQDIRNFSNIVGAYLRRQLSNE